MRIICLLIYLVLSGCADYEAQSEDGVVSSQITTIRFPILKECELYARRILGDTPPELDIKYELIEFDKVFDNFPSNHAFIELSSNFRINTDEVTSNVERSSQEDRQRLITYANSIYSECDAYFSEMFLRFSDSS